MLCLFVFVFVFGFWPKNISYYMQAKYENFGINKVKQKIQNLQFKDKQS